MYRLFIVCFTALLMSSCSSDDRTIKGTETQKSTGSLEAIQEEPAHSQSQSTTDTIAFDVAFSQFLSALQASDSVTLNQFIHPKYGLWIIEQPGAMPKMTNVNHIQDFKREYQNRPFYTVATEVKACELKAEAWPTFDCANMNYEAGKSGYSKDGCFVAGPAKFQKSGYWDYASLQPEQIKSIKSALPVIQKSVLHTATSFEFHFGFIDGHWRLLFTKLIYPCSA